MSLYKTDLLITIAFVIISEIYCSHEIELGPSVSQPLYPNVYYYTIPVVAPLTALAQMNGEGVSGIVTFYQPQPPDGPVFINGNITGLSKGLHGFHIHRDGDLREGCKSLGPHFNPYYAHHGAPNSHNHHAGDLGNIVAGDDGLAKIKIVSEYISLVGPLSVAGRGLVVHEKEDDLGTGGDPESLKTGNAGGRVGCGIIGYTFLFE